jgi:hypothetical protein
MSAVSIEQGSASVSGVEQASSKAARDYGMQNRPTYPLVFQLAGQAVCVPDEYADLHEQINAERQAEISCSVLADHYPLLTDLQASGLVSGALLPSLTSAAKSLNAASVSQALGALFTDSLNQIHARLQGSVLASFSDIEGVAHYLEKSKQATPLYTLSLGSSDFGIGVEGAYPVSLCVESRDFFQHVFLGLSRFDESLRPYLFRAARLLISRGGGGTSEWLAHEDCGYFTDFYSAKGFEWIQSCIGKLAVFANEQPEDNEPLDLFEGLESYQQDVLSGMEEMFGEDVTDLEPEQLLECFVQIEEQFALMYKYEPLNANIPEDVAQFMESEWPESELLVLVKSLLEVVLSCESLDRDVLRSPEDMHCPFGFIFHPDSEAEFKADDRQVKAHDSVYDQTMNAGEDNEIYVLDTAHEGWLEQLKVFYIASFASTLFTVLCQDFPCAAQK